MHRLVFFFFIDSNGIIILNNCVNFFLMKKLFLSVVMFSLLFSYAPLVRAESNTEDLSLLNYILEAADTIQKKLVEQYVALSVYKIKVLYPNGVATTTPFVVSNATSTAATASTTPERSPRAGEFLDIRWDAVGSGVSKVNIYLVTPADNGNRKEPGYTIAKDVPADSPLYRWLIPNNLSGENYKIFIRNNGRNYRLGDYSDNSFNILPPSASSSMVKLEYPKGGEMYIAGRTYSVHWNMPKLSDKYVSFRLLKGDAAATSTDYVPSNLDGYIPASQGSTEWHIPDNIVSGDYKLKIIGTSNLSFFEPVSSNFVISPLFKIIKSADIPNKIVLLSPPPVSQILASTTQTISWITPYDLDRMDIFLRGLPSGRNYIIKQGVESGRPIDDNKVQWLAKSPDPKDELFTIRVCRSGTGSCAESMFPFVIVPEKTTATTTSTGVVVEPDTPEYDRLREIVGGIKDIVIKKTAVILPPEKDEEPEVDDIDYSSPKQSGYLPYNFDRRLSVGMIDDDGVRALQEALIREDLFDHPITGRFFGITEAAVKAFQNKYGLEPSGSVGPGTQQKLNELYNLLVDVDSFGDNNATTTPPVRATATTTNNTADTGTTTAPLLD